MTTFYKKTNFTLSMQTKQRRISMNKKLFIIAIALLISTILFGQNSGGPDAFGYSWISSNDVNGPAYNWITPNANATLITGMDDTTTHPVPIGFNFNFYGVSYDSLTVSSDGILSFSGTSSLSNQDMPDPSNPNNLIAWYWDDMDPGFDTLATQVYYENITFDGGNAFLISFIDYYEYLYNGGGKVTAQVILTENGEIFIQYQQIDDIIDRNSCSVGIENADGSTGLTYCYNDGANLSDNLAIRFYTIEAGYPGFAQNPVPANGSEGLPLDGNLAWDFGIDTDTYDLWLGPAGNMTEVVTGAAAGTTGSYSYSGLTAGTDYEWKLVLHNTNTRFTTEGSTWTFRTQAGAISTFPWTEDFSVWPPVDWTFAGDRDWAQHSASVSAYCHFWGWSDGIAQMITPPIAVPAQGNYSFMFDWSSLYSATYPNDSLAVLISTDGVNWTEIFSEVGPDLDSNDGAGNITPGTFVNYSYNLSAYAGQTVIVNFYAASGYGPDVFIDNVSVMNVANPPGCTTSVAPTDTTTVTEFGTLRWNSAQLATSYKVSLGSSTGNYDVYNDVVVDSLTLDYGGLAYDTQYFWKVIPQNASGDASGCPEWTFTTRSNPTINTFPYNEDFENGIPTAWTHDESLEDMWNILTTIDYAADMDNTTGSGNFLGFDDSGTGQDNAAIATSPFDVTGLTSPVVSFFFWNGDVAQAEQAQSTLSIDIYSNGSWNNGVATYGYSPAWSEVNIDLTSFSASDLTLRFNAIGTDSFYGDIAIDDIAIYDNVTAPACNALNTPADMAVDIIEAGTLTWSGSQGATGYKVSLGTDNPPTNIEDGLDVGAALSYDFSGLTFGTTYYWMVTPYNTNGEPTGCPVRSFTVRADPTISTFPWTEDFSVWPLQDWVFAGSRLWAEDSGSGSAYCNFWGWSDGEAHMVTPPIALPATGSYSFGFNWSHLYSTTYPTDSAAVLVSTDGVNWNMEWTLGGTNFDSNDGAANTAPGTFTYAEFNLDSYLGQTIYIDVVGYTGYGPNFYVDNATVFSVSTPPGCSTADTPADGANEIIEMGTLRWNTTGGTTGYKLFFGSDNPPTNIENGTDLGNVQTYDFSGLAFNTTYYWTVVPYNTNGDATGCPVWSFTTRPDPTVTNFPWTEDFSSFPLEPRGWSYGGTQQWAEDAGSGSIFANFWSWSTGNAELYSPPIALTGNADLLFKWSHTFNTSYPDDAFEVSVSTDQSNWTVVWSIQDSLFESNDGAQSTAPGTFVQETVNIDAYSGQTIYLKFDGISGYGPNLYLDDVGVNITTPPDDDLTVITVIGNTTPMVGSPSDYTISVRNNGLNTQSTYDVKLMLAPDTELGTIAGTTIAHDQINDYVITWIPQAGMEGNQNIFGKVVLAGDEGPGNDASAPLPVNVQASQTGIQGYVRDINGNPLFNAQVLIEELQSVQYTGNNGFYQFLNVPVETYTVTASLTNYDNNTQTNVVVTQDNLTDVNFTMTQGAILMGTVYDHANVEVAGALVEIEQLAITTTTDAQGNYTFVQVTPGTYTVNATKDGYIDQTESNVVIAADATVDLDIILNEYGHFTVNITTNLSSPTGAIVELTDGTNTYTETSDDTGVVLLNEVLPGTYNLTASLPDCNIHEQQNIVIVNGDNTPVDVTLDEILIAPTNIQWLNNDRILVWQHGDRIYGTRADGETALVEGSSYVERDSDNEEDERAFMYFRVEIDIINQTTSDTFFTVTGFNIGEQLTATITAVYETGTAAAPDFDFTFEEVANDPDDVNLVTELKGNYPNPFNPTTHIEFSLKKAGNVELAIYNINGQKVRTLISEEMEADNHKVTWNGKDDRGNSVSSGTYFYRLQTSETTQTKKMLMLK